MEETEKNNDKFFEGLEITVEEKTKELRTQIRASHQNTTEQLKAGNRELAALIKGVNEDAAQARDITKEVENFRKEFEKAKSQHQPIEIGVQRQVPAHNGGHREGQQAHGRQV